MNDRVVRRVVIPEDLAGKRLDQAAASMLTEFSRSRLKAWIEGGQLTVEGASGEPKQRVKGGEALLLDAVLEPAIPVEPESIPVEIVYEDDALIVIDKRPGLVVHPGAGNPSGTLQNALLGLDASLAAIPRAGIIHRLDKDTGGLLIVARTPRARAAMVEQLGRREVRRVYEAICQGALTGGGTIEAAIERHSRDRTRMAVREPGRPARTHYRVLERFRAHSLIEVELETGRTHQIRVHMAHIRAPLVGDPVYGGRPKFPRRPSARLREALQRFPRQALHATRLTFMHPVRGIEMTFASPLPEDMAGLLEALRLDARGTGQ